MQLTKDDLISFYQPKWQLNADVFNAFKRKFKDMFIKEKDSPVRNKYDNFRL